MYWLDDIATAVMRLLVRALRKAKQVVGAWPRTLVIGLVLLAVGVVTAPGLYTPLSCAPDGCGHKRASGASEMINALGALAGGLGTLLTGVGAFIALRRQAPPRPPSSDQDPPNQE